MSRSTVKRNLAVMFTPVVAIAVLLIAAAAPAAVVLDEHFDYAPGSLVTANPAWDDTTGGGFDVTSPGLTHPDLAGESGNAASGLNDRSTISLGTTFGDANEVVYLSFLMQTDSNQHDSAGGSFETIELLDGTTREYAIGLLRGDGNTSSAQFEQRAYDLGNTVTPDLGAFTSATHLFVAKFNYTSSGDALTIDAWLDPNALTDFDSASNRITIGSGAFDFTHLAMAGFSQHVDDVTFDEIRVASTPPAFVPAPASLPTALVLLVLGTVLFGRRIVRPTVRV